MDTRRLQHYLGHAAITNTVQSRRQAVAPEPVAIASGRVGLGDG
jgi:hypothetical protein